MSAPIRPPERYGDDQPAWHRLLARVLVVTLGALALVWLVWAALSSNGSQVNGTVVLYKVVNSSTVEATVDVSSRSGAPVRCDVEARSRAHLPVGTAVVEVPASEKDLRRVTIVIRTQEEAASAVVTHCALA